MLTLLLLLLLSGVSLLTADEDNYSTSGNDAIDEMLQKFRESEDIQRKINPLVINNRLELDDGKGYVENIRVQGLSSLMRYGNANVTFHGLESVSVQGQLGAVQVQLSGRYSYRPSRFFKLNGELGALLSRIVADITMQVGVETKRAVITNFRIVDMGDIRVTKFTGASFAFNWLGKFILNKMLKSRNNFMSEELEEKAMKALNELLRDRDIHLQSL